MRKFISLLVAILSLCPLSVSAQWIDGMFYVHFDDGLHLRIGKGGDVVIPERVEIDGAMVDVEIIESGAFRDNQDLESVVIPSTVKEIHEYAFAYCRSLRNVTLPSTSVSGLTLGNGCFAYCYNLASIEIPNSVVSIGGFCFGETALTEVVIPESVSSVSSECFMSCSDLKRVTIPSTVTTISYGAFWNCSSLTDIIMESPVAITSLEKNSFMGCTSLLSFTVPATTTSLGDGCFSGCSAIESIEIPSSVTSIGRDCFNGCGALKYISPIPPISELGVSTFSGCSSLTSIELPSTLTSVASWCFNGCDSITKVVCHAVVPPPVDYLSITGMNRDCIIYVPDESVEAYRTTGRWSIYEINPQSSLTGISEVEMEKQDAGPMYDINGIRRQSAGKGIYIINGKKIAMDGK